MGKWAILLVTMFSIGCTSVEVGGGYIKDGWATEVTGMGKVAGARLSVGQERLPEQWKTDKVNRYALGALVQIKLPANFYVEPRADIAYYSELGTEWELEVGARLGYKYKGFSIYVGVRHPMGNGDRHEAEGEFEHIPDGFKPEAGLLFTINW